MSVILVKPGEEVMESLTRPWAEQGVQQGAIVSLIGAIDACCISNMPSKMPVTTS